MSRTEPLNEVDARAVSAAEADLMRLLSIEPSPGFTATVRARIAEEAPQPWWGGRRIGMLATVAAAVLVVVILRGSHTNDERSPLAIPTRPDIVLNTEKNKPATPIVSAAAVMSGQRRQVRRAPDPAQQTEIVIDPAIREAIRRLAIASRYTALDGSKGDSLEVPNSEYETLPIARPLDVPELTLGPADQTGGQ